MYRDTDSSCLVSNRPGDRLSDPPGRVGRELVAAAVLKLIHRFHQADVAFLNQVKELKTPVGVLFGDRDDKTQVCLDHFFFGAAGFGFADVHPLADILDLMDAQSGDVLEILKLVAQVFELVCMGFKHILVAFFTAHHAANPEKLRFLAHKFGDKGLAVDPGFLHADFGDFFFQLAHFVNDFAHHLGQVIDLSGDKPDFHQLR